jgi:hypothetical protein
VKHGHDKKPVEAGGETFPAHNQAAVLPPKPNKRPLDLEARDSFCSRPAPRLAALPHPFANLEPEPTRSEAMTEVFGLIPLIRPQHREALTWFAPARADVEGIQQRDDLVQLVMIEYPILGRHGRGLRQDLRHRFRGSVKRARLLIPFANTLA